MNMLKILKNHYLEKLIKTDNLVYSTNFPNNNKKIMLWSQISNESWINDISETWWPNLLYCIQILMMFRAFCERNPFYPWDVPYLKCPGSTESSVAISAEFLSISHSLPCHTLYISCCLNCLWYFLHLFYSIAL